MDLFTNIQLSLFIMAPALVAVSDALGRREDRTSRLLISLAMLLLGVITVFSLDKTYLGTLLLGSGALALFYSQRWLKGMGKLTVLLAGGALMLIVLAEALPGIGLWARYKAYFYFLFNVGVFTVPPLLLWHLWSSLPLMLDALRGGNWRETGVPVQVRYRLLSGLTVVLLLSSTWLLSAYSTQRGLIRTVVQGEVQTMLSELEYVQLVLQASGQDAVREAFYHVKSYQMAARRLSSVLSPAGYVLGGEHHTLAQVLPEGMRELMLAGRLADAAAVATALREAIAEESSLAVLGSTRYKRMADAILSFINSAGLTAYFDCGCP